MSLFGNFALYNSFDPLRMPLTLVAEEPNVTVSFDVYNRDISGLMYRTSKTGEWQQFISGQEILLPEIGSSVQFWHTKRWWSDSAGTRISFRLSGRCRAAGNIQSLLNWGTSYPWGCFNHLFLGQPLTTLPLIPYGPDNGYYFNSAFMSTALEVADVRNMNFSKDYAAYRIFRDCKSLRAILTDIQSWPTNLAISQWVSGTMSKTGIFRKPYSLAKKYGESAIPSRWTIVSGGEESIPLTFTAEEADASVALETVGTLSVPGIHYRMGMAGEWLPYTVGEVISLPAVGDTCQFWNSEDTLSTSSGQARFRIPKKVAASGNIQSLLNWREDVPAHGFRNLFASNSTGLTFAPLMPARVVGECGYDSMYIGCTSLQEVCMLAGTLSDKMCRWMFQSCYALKALRVNFTEWNTGNGSAEGDATYHWLFNNGTWSGLSFYKPEALSVEFDDSNRIPTGCAKADIEELIEIADI